MPSPQERLVLCGASIGANLSLKAAAEGLRPAGIVLLSPGLSYAGIEAGAYLEESGAIPLLLAASAIPAGGTSYRTRLRPVLHNASSTFAGFFFVQAVIMAAMMKGL